MGVILIAVIFLPFIVPAVVRTGPSNLLWASLRFFLCIVLPSALLGLSCVLHVIAFTEELNQPVMGYLLVLLLILPGLWANVALYAIEIVAIQERRRVWLQVGLFLGCAVSLLSIIISVVMGVIGEMGMLDDGMGDVYLGFTIAPVLVFAWYALRARHTWHHYWRPMRNQSAAAVSQATDWY